MKEIFSDCVKYNYQEMICAKMGGSSMSENHRCTDQSVCVGCDCDPSTKYNTAVAVGRMFDHMDKFQKKWNVNFSDNFPPNSYTDHATQLHDHQVRMRIRVSSSNCIKHMAVDPDCSNTVKGLGPLLTGRSMENAHPPINYNTMRFTNSFF
jgi:hypothetical protein